VRPCWVHFVLQIVGKVLDKLYSMRNFVRAAQQQRRYSTGTCSGAAAAVSAADFVRNAKRLANITLSLAKDAAEYQVMNDSATARKN
jgi:cobalamin biosynthesis protein CbiD